MIVILFVMSGYNTYMASSKESFTPYLRKLYRPHIRNVRLTMEEFVDKRSTYLQNILRRIGIM